MKLWSSNPAAAEWSLSRARFVEKHPVLADSLGCKSEAFLLENSPVEVAVQMPEEKQEAYFWSVWEKISSVKEVEESPSAYKSSESEKAEKSDLHSLIFAKIFNHLLQPISTINFLDMAEKDLLKHNKQSSFENPEFHNAQKCDFLNLFYS